MTISQAGSTKQVPVRAVSRLPVDEQKVSWLGVADAVIWAGIVESGLDMFMKAFGEGTWFHRR